MATILSHGIAAAALGVAFPQPKSARFWFYGVICSMVPDVDVIGFRLGIRYEDLLGHRGLTHSIAFALLFSGIVAAAIQGREPQMKWKIVWPYLFLATISHAILDAFTNGGLGVAFFAPFSDHRYFFPWNPIEVSPIGARFFGPQGLEVLLNEVIWIWMPSAALVVAVCLLSRLLSVEKNSPGHDESMARIECDVFRRLISLP